MELLTERVEKNVVIMDEAQQQDIDDELLVAASKAVEDAAIATDRAARVLADKEAAAIADMRAVKEAMIAKAKKEAATALYRAQVRKDAAAAGAARLVRLGNAPSAADAQTPTNAPMPDCEGKPSKMRAKRPRLTFTSGPPPAFNLDA